MSEHSFSELKLLPTLQKNVQSLGYEQMTPIQAQSLPVILEGKDLIGQAKTGSGKTAAFGLGILQKLNVSNMSTQALVLCPTRELADQVGTALRQLARTMPNVKTLVLVGGAPFWPQSKSLEHGAHIVVGTPGRIGKHLRKNNLKLNGLKTFVLDEGDRMVEMGFKPELDAIVDFLPRRRQNLLFSATMPLSIVEMAEHIMHKPQTVKVDTTHDHESIRLHFYNVGEADRRIEAVRLLLMQHRPESTVVFCNTKKDAMELARILEKSGFSVAELHGDLEQRERDDTLVRFMNKSVAVLVATDVAARGLDIDALDAVINYHIPRDFEVFTHRVGRTGRAGSKGIACSLYSPKEQHKMSLFEGFLGQKIMGEPLPDRKVLNGAAITAPMTTLHIGAGKKQKLRPGNILGALTGENGLTASDVGKITVCESWAYVAVSRKSANFAIKKLSREKWKGRPLKVRLFD